MKRKVKVDRLILCLLVLGFMCWGVYFGIDAAVKALYNKSINNFESYIIDKGRIYPDIEYIEPMEIEEIELPEEESNLTCLGQFLLTGYDDCEECQEEWVGTTALGVAPQANHTIAVDPNIISLGSHVIINGVEYVAEDVGGGVNGNHIDIFVGSHEETFSSFCNGYAEVYLVNEG